MLRIQPSEEYLEEIKKYICQADFEHVSIYVQEAIENNYDLNAHDLKTGYTLLHFAVRKTTLSNEEDMLSILELLKNAGCKINAVASDRFNNTPIHTASRRALSQTLTWLLENGGNHTKTDNQGHSPLYYVEKQLQSINDHMKTNHRYKLQEIKNILITHKSENNLVKYGLFTVAVATVAAVSVMRLTC